MQAACRLFSLAPLRNHLAPATTHMNMATPHAATEPKLPIPRFWPARLPRAITPPAISLWHNLAVSALRYPDKNASCDTRGGPAGLNCAGFGSSACVTSVFGLAAASHAIKLITG